MNCELNLFSVAKLEIFLFFLCVYKVRGAGSLRTLTDPIHIVLISMARARSTHGFGATLFRIYFQLLYKLYEYLGKNYQSSLVI